MSPLQPYSCSQQALTSSHTSTVTPPAPAKGQDGVALKRFARNDRAAKASCTGMEAFFVRT
jgi:hypothetical protein